MWEGSFVCEFFYVDQCVQRECVVGEGGLYGYFREQGLSMGVQECLEGFHRGCIDYLSWHFVAEGDSPNGETLLATGGTVYLLVELIGMGA